MGDAATVTRVKKILGRLNPFHTAVLLGAVVVLAVSVGIAALGFAPAGFVALLALIVLAYYWWGGFFDLID